MRAKSKNNCTYVAWLGDTQAFISRNEGKVSQLVSPPHRPNIDVLLQDLKQLYVAWLGDTQAIISRNEGKVSQLVSPPHRPNIDSERERIERMGGFVSQFRVQGILAVSRAIGAKDFKPYVCQMGTTLCAKDFKPYVCADPDVICLDLDGSAKDFKP
ncbi:probable protein phosphatase 2C 60, partial [Diaphorina citri]|uniref:Probable protein phosphatase 2C 60 n=1 Tax=Diaphorina citri TaxID=121845 RepID=A0A3Q0JMR1_DIACI